MVRVVLRIRRKTRNFLMNFFLFGFVVFLFLFSFEVILRSADIGCLTLDDDGNRPFVFYDDWYEMMPNFEGRFKCLEFDTSVKTNNHGFRDSEFDDDKKIMLLLGDSVVFGQGVEEEEALSEILEGDLEGFSVYNMGVVGYGPKEYLKQLEIYLPEFKPEIVMVVMYEGNEVQENCGIINRIGFFKDKDKKFGSVKVFLRSLYTIRLVEPLMRNIIDLGETRLTSKEFYLIEEPGYIKECNELLKESMGMIKDVSLNHNTKLMFLILPSKTNFEKSNDEMFDYNRKLDAMMEICLDLNLKCLNVIEYIDNPKGLYFKEGHINKEGHKVVGGLAKDFLKKENLIK